MDRRAELERAIWERGARREGSEVRFLCPAHDDHNPSARWNASKGAWYCDGCGSGGGETDLCRRLGLIADEPHQELTLSVLADAKGLPESFLRFIGVKEGIAGPERSRCVDIPYLDREGEVEAVRKRVSLTGVPRFLWRRGDKPSPYGVWRLTDPSSRNVLLLVEGESDCWTLWFNDFCALGIPGASTWKEAWRVFTQGFDEVFVWHELDQGGDILLPRVTADLPGIRIIEPPPDAKDPNALWLACGKDGAAFQRRLEVLMAKARPASELRAEELSGEALVFLEQARHLLEDPKLMDRIRETIRLGGYAGDLTPPLLAYISLTSRMLERPLNLSVLAPSASGKNRAVDAALLLVPESAYHLEKAGSARALIYAEGDFAGKVVVVAEADSIPEEGPAASAIRSLAADNYMSYDVVEKDSSGQFVTRHIEKPGPTGLITTSTRPLGEQMSTRMLAATVADTPEQTRAVLLAHAANVNGEQPETDLVPFLAMQRWLEIAGEHRVTIPYARALAGSVPDRLVRMRRDFRQLLTVVQTIALLHQKQRPRDGSGRILAQLDDYRIARELLIDAFTTAATGGISKNLRETVEAVTRLYDGENAVTVKGVGDHLGLARDTAWHRMRQAIRLGYVVNRETRKGQPAQLVPGDALPEEKPALPTVEELEMSVRVEQPETGSTVQPAAASEVSPESEEPVENPVEDAFQPGIQPDEPPASDLQMVLELGTVERLNAERQGQDTRTDSEADRVYAFSLAEVHGFPSLSLRPGETVMAGRESWDKFIHWTSAERIRGALALLENLGGRSQ